MTEKATRSFVCPFSALLQAFILNSKELIYLKALKLIHWIARNYDPAVIRTILQKESNFSNDYNSIRWEKQRKNAANEK